MSAALFFDPGLELRPDRAKVSDFSTECRCARFQPNNSPSLYLEFGPFQLLRLMPVAPRIGISACFYELMRARYFDVLRCAKVGLEACHVRPEQRPHDRAAHDEPPR